MEKRVIIGIVHYCTEEYLKRAYNSIRKYYPNIKVVIVDGSPRDHRCRYYLHEIDGENTQVIFCNQNIGHAKGMNIIMEQAKEGQKVVVMDSDAAIIREGVLEAMDELLPDAKYGIGHVITVDKFGDTDKSGEGTPYLHPYFAMINKDVYLDYPEFKHHGAPFLSAMKELPSGMLINFNLENFVEHRWRGTRDLRPREFESVNWDDV